MRWSLNEGLLFRTLKFFFLICTFSMLYSNWYINFTYSKPGFLLQENPLSTSIEQYRLTLSHTCTILNHLSEVWPSDPRCRIGQHIFHQCEKINLKRVPIPSLQFCMCLMYFWLLLLLAVVVVVFRISV